MKKHEIWEKPAYFKASAFFTKKIYELVKDPEFLEAVSECFSAFEAKYLTVGYTVVYSGPEGTRAVVFPAKKQEFTGVLSEAERTIFKCNRCGYFIRNNEGHDCDCPYFAVLSVLKS